MFIEFLFFADVVDAKYFFFFELIYILLKSFVRRFSVEMTKMEYRFFELKTNLEKKQNHSNMK